MSVDNFTDLTKNVESLMETVIGTIKAIEKRMNELEEAHKVISGQNLVMAMTLHLMCSKGDIKRDDVAKYFNDIFDTIIKNEAPEAFTLSIKNVLHLLSVLKLPLDELGRNFGDLSKALALNIPPAQIQNDRIDGVS